MDAAGDAPQVGERAADPRLRGVEQLAQRVVAGLLLGHAQVERHGGQPDLGTVVQVTLDAAQCRDRVLDRDRPGALKLADPARAEQGAGHPGVKPCHAARHPHAGDHAGGAGQRRGEGAARSSSPSARGQGTTAFSGPSFVPRLVVAEQQPHQRVGDLRQADGGGDHSVPFGERERQLDQGIPDGPPAVPVAQPPVKAAKETSAAAERRGRGAVTRSPGAARSAQRCSAPSRRARPSAVTTSMRPITVPRTEAEMTSPGISTTATAMKPDPAGPRRSGRSPGRGAPGG